MTDAQAVLNAMYEVNMDFGEENAKLAAAAAYAARAAANAANAAGVRLRQRDLLLRLIKEAPIMDAAQ